MIVRIIKASSLSFSSPFCFHLLGDFPKLNESKMNNHYIEGSEHQLCERCGHHLCTEAVLEVLNTSTCTLLLNLSSSSTVIKQAILSYLLQSLAKAGLSRS